MQNINIISVQEIQLFYGFTKTGAAGKLTNIKKTLGKAREQKITVIDLCKYEGITIDDFDLLMARARGKKIAIPTPAVQANLFS